MKAEDREPKPLVSSGPRPEHDTRNPSEEGEQTISMADLLDHLEGGGTLGTLMPRSQSSEALGKKIKGRKLKGDPEEYERLLKTRPPLPPNFKERNTFEQTFRERELKSMFEGSPNWTPVGSVLRDPRDPHYAKEGGLANLTSLRLTQTTYSKAPDVALRLIQLPFDKFTPQEIRAAWELVRRCWDFQVTSGPVNGLYRRVAESTRKPKPREPSVDIARLMKAGISEFLPFDPLRCYDMRGRSLKECSRHIILNLSSTSGYPWDKPKKDVAKEAYEEACQLLNAIADGTIAKYAKENPQLTLVQMKNKLDLYEYADTKKSIRQYFVFPFHWTYLFSAVMQNATKGFVGFWENPRSMNAHGFSWNYGGGDRIYSWILWAKSQGPGIYAIAYSDDQLWVAVCEDGKTYVLAPDYRRMDMNLPGWVGKFAFQHLTEQIGHLLDKTWTAVLRENCRMAFDTLVIIGYSLVYRASNFLKSGVTGTAEFDQYASAMAFALVKEGVGKPKDLADLLKRLEGALDRVRGAIGLVVKPETLRAHPFEEGQDRYEWAFLGKSLWKFHDHYVPGSDPVRALASMTSPKKKLTHHLAISGQMTRVRDIIASGGFVHPLLYHSARMWYETMRKLDNRPKDPLEPDVDEVNSFKKPTNIDPLLKEVGDRFPELEEILNLYFPASARIVQTAAGTVSGPEAQKEQVTLKTALEEMYSGDSWADSEPGFTDRSGQDKGDVSIPKPSQVPVEQQGRIVPLPKEVKAKYNERIRELYRERLAQAAGLRGFDRVLGPAKRRGRTTKFDRLMAAVDQAYEEHDAYVNEESELPAYDFRVPEEVWEDFNEDDYHDLDEEMERRAHLRVEKRGYF